MPAVKAGSNFSSGCEPTNRRQAVAAMARQTTSVFVPTTSSITAITAGRAARTRGRSGEAVARIRRHHQPAVPLSLRHPHEPRGRQATPSRASVAAVVVPRAWSMLGAVLDIEGPRPTAKTVAPSPILAAPIALGVRARKTGRGISRYLRATRSAQNGSLPGPPRQRAIYRSGQLDRYLEIAPCWSHQLPSAEDPQHPCPAEDARRSLDQGCPDFRAALCFYKGLRGQPVVNSGSKLPHASPPSARRRRP